MLKHKYTCFQSELNSVRGEDWVKFHTGTSTSNKKAKNAQPAALAKKATQPSVQSDVYYVYLIESSTSVVQLRTYRHLRDKTFVGFVSKWKFSTSSLVVNV